MSTKIFVPSMLIIMAFLFCSFSGVKKSYAGTPCGDKCKVDYWDALGCDEISNPEEFTEVCGSKIGSGTKYTDCLSTCFKENESSAPGGVQKGITINKDITVGGTKIRAVSIVSSDGSVIGATNLPAGSVSYSAVSTAVNNSESPDGGLPGSSPDVSSPAKCGINFTEIGGVCFPNTGLPDPQGGITQILSNIFSWLMGLFTTIAVMAFVVSGIQYLTSTGDEKQLETAKRNAKYSLLGIIVGLSGFVLVKAIAAAISAQGFFF